MRIKTKRFLSLLVSVLMILTMLPAAAIAEGLEGIESLDSEEFLSETADTTQEEEIDTTWEDEGGGAAFEEFDADGLDDDDEGDDADDEGDDGDVDADDEGDEGAGDEGDEGDGLFDEPDSLAGSAPLSGAVGFSAIAATDAEISFGILSAGDAEVVATFPGVTGVRVEYSPNSSKWTLAVPSADGGYTFDIPAADIPRNLSGEILPMTIRAVKGAMIYSETYTLVPDGTVNFDVPTTVITATGIEATCNLGVVQNNSWVYTAAAASVGADNEFPVFTNGKPYDVRLQKTGFYTIAATGLTAGDTVDFSSCFYSITVPDGVSSVRIVSSGNIITGAKAGDVIDLLRDEFGTYQPATMTFLFGGQTYSLDFMLDGSNPFDTKYVKINFPGIQKVSVSYVAGGWGYVDGTFDNTTNLIKLPAGVTSIDVAKGGMRYTFGPDELPAAFGFITELTVPIITLRVIGLAAPCSIALVQNSFVYTVEELPTAVGQHTYLVFDNYDNYGNGLPKYPYVVALYATGFHPVYATASENWSMGEKELWAYFNNFYQVEVPEGMTEVALKSAGYVIGEGAPAKAGDKIALLVDWDDYKTAEVTFTWKYVDYPFISFPLNGVFDPFATYKVTYNGNGGVLDDGTDERYDLYLLLIDEEATIQDGSLFEKDGYVFTGWNTEPDGTGDDYAAGDIVKAPLTLYAQWEKSGYDITVNFPGVEGVTVEYYSNTSGGWVTVGTADDTLDFVLPKDHKATWGVTSVRAVKGGMSYTFEVDGADLVLGDPPLVLDVPIIPLWVVGIWADGCTLGVVQDNWVYQDVPGVVSGTTVFNVFDNDKDYLVRLNKAGFFTIERKAVEGVGILYVYFADTVFYQATVPAGITNVRMQSNNWIVNPANQGDIIDLLKDDDNIRNASMTFDWRGKNYKVEFKLNGDDPFDVFKTVTYDGYGGFLSDGVTGTYADPGNPYITDPLSPSVNLISDPEEVTVLGVMFDNPGYTFLGWNTEADGSGTPYAPGEAFLMPGDDVVLYAQWEEAVIQYTINFKLNGGELDGSTDDWYIIVAKGSLLTDPGDPTKDGYQFEGWYTEVSNTKWDWANHHANHNNTLVAKWTALYTVNFKLNGGELDGSTDDWYIIVAEGSLLTDPGVPTKDGYLFDGWYTEVSNTKWDWANHRANHNNTLIAQWTALYTITFV
ncbi:MAG: InlB B-repeat-containing protein, partial [Coriobacteriia bacterium]|nr:InlB B-repeat-containing protein [Coriobacteriia bacterium]